MKTQDDRNRQSERNSADRALKRWRSQQGAVFPITPSGSSRPSSQGAGYHREVARFGALLMLAKVAINAMGPQAPSRQRARWLERRGLVA